MFTLIETEEDLDFLNTELLQKPYLGVDTEFRRTRKDNMKLAQVSKFVEGSGSSNSLVL